MATILHSLLTRYAIDASASGASRGTAQRLAVALDAIGWRAASDLPADELAPELAMIVGACAERHRDLSRLYRDVAECLRQHAHHLDGSAASASEWEPAAVRIITLYVGG